MGLKGLITVAAALLVAGCAYQGSPGEGIDKEKMQAVSVKFLVDYIDPKLWKELEASNLSGPELALRLPVQKAPEILDESSVDTRLLGKDVSRFSVMPLISNPAVITASMTVGSRLMVFTFALLPRGDQPIAPWTRTGSLQEEPMVKEWSEEKAGTKYRFGYYRVKDKEQLCVSEMANASMGNMLVVACARTKDVGFAELESVVRTASIGTKVPAAGK